MDVQDFVEKGGSDAYTFRFVYGAEYDDKTNDEIEDAMIKADELISYQEESR